MSAPVPITGSFTLLRGGGPVNPACPHCRDISSEEAQQRYLTYLNATATFPMCKAATLCYRCGSWIPMDDEAASVLQASIDWGQR